MVSDFSWIIGAFGVIATMIGIVMGTVKWLTASSERRIEKIFEEHKKIFEGHYGAIRDNEKMIMDTRDEMHRDYVRHDHLNKFTEETRTSLVTIRKTMEAVARDVNRLIGRQRSSSNDEPTI